MTSFKCDKEVIGLTYVRLGKLWVLSFNGGNCQMTNLTIQWHQWSRTIITYCKSDVQCKVSFYRVQWHLLPNFIFLLFFLMLSQNGPSVPGLSCVMSRSTDIQDICPWLSGAHRPDYNECQQSKLEVSGSWIFSQTQPWLPVHLPWPWQWIQEPLN